MLFIRKGVFLGFIVDENSILANPYKVLAIRNRLIPKTIIKIKGFINAAGYFRSLINNYATLIGYLTDYCGKAKEALITLTPKA